jgi:DNA-binding NtrC family response regulator
MLDVKYKTVRELIDHNLVVRGRGAREILDRFRNSVVVRALRLSGGNLQKTARMLDLDAETLRRWMREGGIDKYYSL